MGAHHTKKPRSQSETRSEFPEMPRISQTERAPCHPSVAPRVCSDEPCWREKKRVALPKQYLLSQQIKAIGFQGCQSGIFLPHYPPSKGLGNAHLGRFLVWPVPKAHSVLLGWRRAA